MINIQGDKKILIANKKKSDLRIAIDMDGVVAYWEKSAARTLDINLKDKKIRKEIKNGKRLESYVGGDNVMWPLIDKEGEKWWEEIEKLPWADDLIKLAGKYTKELFFLSSPSNNPICYSGKAKWLLKNYPDMSKDAFFGSKKFRIANPNILLIDDSKDKIKKFRKYGGHSFHWPCPLSIIDDDKNIDELLNELEEYINEIV